LALGPRGARLLAAAALAALAVGVYSPIRQHEFLNYDDDIYITANPGVALGWSREGVAWAFTTFQGANWFPLTRLSWMLDHELHGLDPAGFHGTSLALHALSTALLFLALARMSGSPARSAFVAAIFAVHPLHVESVAWASARKDTLSGLFFALALLAYAPAAGRDRPRLRIAAVSVCLTLGLLAKQMLVTLPFVLLLLDDWPLARLRRRDDPERWDPAALRGAVVEKWPLFALVALLSAVAVIAQRSAGSVADLRELPLAARFANIPVAYVGYLAKAFWPAGLAVFYPHPEAGLSAGRVVGCLALLLALTALALRGWRRRPAPAVGWLWYLGTLVPVIGLVQVGSQALADRYTYLPLVGLAIGVGWGAPELAARLLPEPRRRAALLAAAAIACIAVLSVATSRQLRHWRDSEALMRHALAVTGDNAVAHAHLGIALLERGQVEEAIVHWREATRVEPGFLTVTNNLAWLLATHPESRHRDPAAAVELAERAARLAPGNPGVLDTLAAAYASTRRFDDAVRTASLALSLAERSGATGVAAQIRSRLALYRRGTPYIER
jgi:tetratricopeptide (TPR) repeat protein